MLGFCVIATAASLKQYEFRPYLHYFLLAAPTAIIAGVQAALATARRLTATWPSVSMRLALVTAAVFVLEPGRLEHPGHSPGDTRRHTGYGARTRLPRATYRRLRRILQPGEDVLVLPPRRNEIHVVAGTRSTSFPHGYGWLPAPRIIDKAIDNPALRGVVVIKRLDSTDSLVWRLLGCSGAVRQLPDAGFHLVRDLPTMTLWQR